MILYNGLQNFMFYWVDFSACCGKIPGDISMQIDADLASYKEFWGSLS